MSDTVEAPKRRGRPPKEAPPKLGTPASGKWLIDTILKAYPDCKPRDFFSLMTSMRYAQNLGSYWGKQTRKG